MKTNLVKIFLFTAVVYSLTSCSPSTKENKEADQASTSSSAEAAYQLVWADEFDGDSLNMDNWNYQLVPPGYYNDEWQAYTDSRENAYIEDGSLVIKAIYTGEEHGMGQYTSARLNTANKQSWKYGKIVGRMKLPFSMGLWPAFWMLGANINENGGDTPWPQSGEIDIFELYGSHDDAVVEGNIHYANLENKHEMLGAEAYKLKEGIFADDYHEFELEWTEEKLTWRVDGNEFMSADITSEDRTEFHKEFFVLLNIAVGGSFAGRPDESSIFPQMMYVDWIRVYQRI